MQGNLPERPTLAIISDTWMWETTEGIRVHESTLREVEAFSCLFDKIRWVGYSRKAPIINNANITNKKNIQFALLRSTGGNNLSSKIGVFLTLPYYTYKIIKEIMRADIVHTRGPSIPALIAVLFSFLQKKKIFWNKYGGSWGEPSANSYKCLKFLLQKAYFSKVTINGEWQDQKEHVLTFLNPCLNDEELKQGWESAIVKEFNKKLNFCFVGRIEVEKGLDILINAIRSLNYNRSVGKIIIVGDGQSRTYYEDKCKEIPYEIIFTGSLNRSLLNDIYKESHFIVLPSVSEGFPKVIPEAGAFGCIPIVSNIQALDAYVSEGESGYILSENNEKNLADKIEIITQNKDHLYDMMLNVISMSEKFTYKAYTKRVQIDILKMRIEDE